MKFSIGDTVLMKHTGMEGRVVGIINEEMLEIESGGIHFPALIDEMEHPYLNWFMEKEQRPVRKTDPVSPVDTDAVPATVSAGFHLSFLPIFRFEAMDEIVDRLKVYFLNQTRDEIAVLYEFSIRSGTLFSHTFLIPPFASFYLHDIPFEQMNEQPRFSYVLERRGVLSNNRIQDSLRIKPKRLFEYISQLQKEDTFFFPILLAAHFPDAIVEDIKPVGEIKRDKPVVAKAIRKKKPVGEIDLHTEALGINTRGLSNYEILLRQLEDLESALSNAVRLHQQSMVVIHGVGKGKLREEVHALLRSYPGVDFFLHDWSPKYGYGATQVFFDSR